MAMSVPALGQDGVTRQNNQDNMTRMQNQTTTQRDQVYGSGTMNTYGSMTYSDQELSDFSDNARWWQDAFKELSPRDQVVLLMAVRRLPGNEERVIRQVVQRCQSGSTVLYDPDRLGRYNWNSGSVTTSDAMTMKKFTMSDGDIWNNTMDSLTKYERASFAWTWEHMQPSERDAMAKLMRACYERKWRSMNSGS